MTFSCDPEGQSGDGAGDDWDTAQGGLDDDDQGGAGGDWTGSQVRPARVKK